jgi:hypothetical protein
MFKTELTKAEIQSTSPSIVEAGQHDNERSVLIAEYRRQNPHQRKMDGWLMHATLPELEYLIKR